MDLFLLHCLLLLWAALFAARRLMRSTADQLLAAGLFIWGNLVATCLILSIFHCLGDRGWFLGGSVGLAGLGCLLLRNFSPAKTIGAGNGSASPNPWLLGACGLTLAAVAVASVAVALKYAPNQADSLAFHLPRVMYYLGQGSLGHFSAADPRQTCLPFNHELIQLLGLVYSPPLPVLSFFNLAAWALSGLVVHRLCRVCAFSANASLIAGWFALMFPLLLAQAASTTPDLAVGTTLCCTLLFAQRWRQTGHDRDALLAGLAAGLAAGSDLRALVLVLAAGLAALAGNFRRRREPDRLAWRAWRTPVLLASVVGLSFALINLAERDPASVLFPGATSGLATLQRWLQSSGPLDENGAGFGRVSGLFLIAAFAFLLRSRKPAVLCAWWGFGWTLTALLLPSWSPASPRDLVPALLLLSPGVAGIVDFLLTRPSGVRMTGWALILSLALVTGWSDSAYLLDNAPRPFAPLLHGAIPPTTLPDTPLMVKYSLTRQTRINVDTDGANEPIFPLLSLRPDQRFTSRTELDPRVYNLISRSTQSRNASYEDLAKRSAYTFVPMPGKPTAGVEFLATIGQDPAARDYFGLEPDANHTPSLSSNRVLLVSLFAGPASGPGFTKIRIKLAGLNSADGASLRVSLKLADDTLEPLVTLRADGEISVAPTKPFAWLVFQAVDNATGRELGSAALPYHATGGKPGTVRPSGTTGHEALLLDPGRPSGPGSIFVTDLVVIPQTIVSTEGLTPVEGPFPQWDLPLVRWAREPVVRLKIPTMARMARLQLSFSVRTHVRPKAVLEIFFNGSRVRRFQLEGQTTWLDQTLELVPRAGENVIEFRDASGGDTPDWLDYLARYPDVKADLIARGLPAEAGARAHFEMHGRAEGRTVQMIARPAAAPGSFYFLFRRLRLEGFNSP